jgi:thiol:disulfide interchange protein DsbD
MPKAFCFVFLFGYLTSSSVPAMIPDESAHVNVDLATEVQSIQPGQSFSVGLFFALEKGWHTYWLNPGDSGLPVVISWKLPPGFSHGKIQWPYPSRLGSDSVVNFGYEEEVLLITDIKASPTVKQGEMIKIEADVEWLVCKEECLPGQAVLSVSLPVEANEPEFNPIWKEKFVDTRKKVPATSHEWPVHVAIDKDYIFLHITSPFWFRNEMKDIQFFPEQLGLFDYSVPQFYKKIDNGYSIQAKLSALARKIPSKLKGVLVSDKSWSRVSENKALRIVVPLAQQSQEKKTQKEVTR